MGKQSRAIRKIDVKNREYYSPDNRYTVQIALGGKPVCGIQPVRVYSVEEEVMSWNGANHIHGWFVDNVQHGKDNGELYHVSNQELRLLLEVCEKVLIGSQLVGEPAFQASDYSSVRQRAELRGTRPKTIRNVAVAHKLLPTRAWDHSGAGEYNEAYLKDVEATRDWAERMLIDVENGAPGRIYYTSR